MAKGIEILYWNGDQVSGDWDTVYFESLQAAEEAGWVIDETIELGRCLGHFKAAEIRTRMELAAKRIEGKQMEMKEGRPYPSSTKKPAIGENETLKRLIDAMDDLGFRVISIAPTEARYCLEYDIRILHKEPSKEKNDETDIL